MTVKATWLGGPGEPESCEWMGVTFPEGVPVEISDEFMIRKAKGNKFFDVSDDDAPAAEEKPSKADNLAKARAAKAAKNAPLKDVDA
jgi:hypothetical protein